ncbi:hypothetical protein G7B40_042150 [Aetokthonos hydrillicola Thurmond2011]|uniref:Uncharacterized protein n=1 Tax=Aetokthonos hydrillicola Thurmond2011 TaxID=2712845 RepID=A0AAP5MDT2_9CYAN|nr:hypothetical protein [Aetokthonos hydrillicola]MDR9900977.1 hypothetical protein [Aetokthonos hydrillicola Thurmond2011]
MNGLLVRNVSPEIISSAICSMTETVFSVWSTYTLSELLEGVSDDIVFSSDELTVEEFSIPFATNGRFVPVRTTLARGHGNRAVSFLLTTVKRAVASSDLYKSDLINFFKKEFNGNQANLNWYAEQVGSLSQLAEWTLWTDLIDPSEAGYKQLFLAKTMPTLLRIKACLQSCIEGALSEGLDPTAAKSDKAGFAEVVLINVESEIMKIAHYYE